MSTPRDPPPAHCRGCGESRPLPRRRHRRVRQHYRRCRHGPAWHPQRGLVGLASAPRPAGGCGPPQAVRRAPNRGAGERRWPMGAARQGMSAASVSPRRRDRVVATAQAARAPQTGGAAATALEGTQAARWEPPRYPPHHYRHGEGPEGDDRLEQHRSWRGQEGGGGGEEARRARPRSQGGTRGGRQRRTVSPCSVPIGRPRRGDCEGQAGEKERCDGPRPSSPVLTLGHTQGDYFNELISF